MDLRSNLWVFVICAAAAVAFLAVALAASSAVFGLLALIAVGVAFLVGRDVRAGVVALAVDAPGVYFGKPRTSNDEDHTQRYFPWAAIQAVVLCEVWHEATDDHRSTGSWRKAVGVRLDPGYHPAAREQPFSPHERQVLDRLFPAGPRGNEVSAFRTVHGWPLDRAGLEAAVRRFAPNVPVQDGGRQPYHRGSLGDLFRAVRQARRITKGDPAGGTG